MPRPEVEPVDYLTKRGRKIFQIIVKHCQAAEIDSDVDYIQLSMLANSFDVFEQMAQKLNDPSSEGGFIHDVTGKNGTFKQVRPEYSIMKNEHDKIMKLSPSYGLNPGDRKKIFDGMRKKKKIDPAEGLD